MSVIKINKNNFQHEVINSNKPVLLDFYADWCGPCRMVGPFIEEIAEEHPEYLVCKVNVDDEPELAMQYNISSIPAMIVFEKGEPTSFSVGAKPKEKILELLEK